MSPSAPRRALLASAVARRAALRADPDTTAFRLVNAEGDGLPAFTVDLFSDVAVLSLYEALDGAEEQALVEDVVAVVQPRALYLKRRPKEARVVSTTHKDALAPEPPVRGEPCPELQVRENGLAFLIRPGQGLSVGLYLDMRAPRRWWMGQVEGKTVLNCFAYTCAFGVGATAAGAARAVNVDLSRKVLTWGEENARLNGQAVEARDYIAGDVFDWLRRFAKKGESFDRVVLDPPSFAKGREGAFSAASDYAALAAEGARVTAPRGLLLACCNLARLPPERFLAMVQAGVAQAGRRVERLERLGPSPVDFPAPAGAPPALKVLACWLDGGKLGHHGGGSS